MKNTNLIVLISLVTLLLTSSSIQILKPMTNSNSDSFGQINQNDENHQNDQNDPNPNNKEISLKKTTIIKTIDHESPGIVSLDNSLIEKNTRAKVNPHSDLFLDGDDSAVILSDFELKGNVTMVDNASLEIVGANVTINGWLFMANTSKFNVKNSELNLVPPNGITAFTTIINLSGDCVISIVNSQVSILDHEVEMEVPFILATDNVNVTFEDSKFSTKYPPVPIDIRWGTSGLLLLTGSASWNMFDSEIVSDMNMDGAYRWCILQSNALFNARGVRNYINAPSKNAFVKPNSGNIEAKDCHFIGRVPVAVLGHAHFINTTIETELEILDNSVVIIEDSKIDNIKIGWWSGSFNRSLLPDPKLDFINSRVRELFISGNAEVSVLDSTVTNNAEAEKNAIFYFLNSSWSNPKIPFAISDNVTLHIENPRGLKKINVISGDCEIKLTNSELFLLTILEGNVILKMMNSSIDDVRTYGNMEVHGELIDSILNDFKNSESENSTGIFNFTLIDSTIPEPLLGENITTFINYRLELDILLNNNIINTPSIVNFYNDSGFVKAKKSDLNGYVSIDLPYRIVGNNINYTNELFSFETSYLGLSTSEEIRLNCSKHTTFSWVDQKAPKISEIEYSPESWNSQKWVTVRAEVDDEDINVISNVTLFYSSDGGKTWKEKTMFNTENNIYEAIIPRQNRGKKVSFYIIAYDMAGNAEESPVKSYRVGEEYSFIINSLIVLMIILCFMLAIFAWRHHRKIKKYSNLAREKNIGGVSENENKK